MVHKPTATFLTALTAVCLLSGGAWAAQGKCVVGKNKCMSKKAGSLLKCHEKAETPGKPSDPNADGCIDNAQAKFDGGSDPTKGCFEKLESKADNDCATVNDTAAAEAAVDACVNALVAGIDPGTVDQTRCGVGKKKCVAKKLTSILKCYQKAETPGKPTDPNTGGCIDKAQAKFDGGSDPTKGCFVKLEQKAGNDCAPPIGNQGALENTVDSCAGAFAALIENATTTTTTTTTTTASTSTSTSSTSSTTISTGPPTLLDFTTAAAGGTCGDARDASNTVLKTLHCGGLNLGGGASSVPEGPTPDGSTNRFALSCTGSACTVSATSTAPAVNSAEPDCTDTGCNFGAPLEVPNPVSNSLTTCVLNTYQSPGSGTLDLSDGSAVTSAVLTSDIYLTGNVAQACPRCRSGGTPVNGSPSAPVAGTCDRGPRVGMGCTSTNSVGLTRDCLTGGSSAANNCPNGTGTAPCSCQAGVSGHDGCLDGTHVGPISVNLSPLTTTTTVSNAPDGKFCPGQGGTPGTPGCFGKSTCTTITEVGSPAGPMSNGVLADVTLAYVFCVTATPSGLVNFTADLPGPGAVALPGTFRAN